jgi:hypothetical protein
LSVDPQRKAYESNDKRAHLSDILTMARGWESKAIEDQIEQSSQFAVEPPRAAQSSDAPARKQKLDALRLMRSRLDEQLQRARSVTHRQMLHQSLRAIEAEIEALESVS